MKCPKCNCRDLTIDWEFKTLKIYCKHCYADFSYNLTDYKIMERFDTDKSRTITMLWKDQWNGDCVHVKWYKFIDYHTGDIIDDLHIKINAYYNPPVKSYHEIVCTKCHDQILKIIDNIIDEKDIICKRCNTVIVK